MILTGSLSCKAALCGRNSRDIRQNFLVVPGSNEAMHRSALIARQLLITTSTFIVYDTCQRHFTSLLSTPNASIRLIYLSSAHKSTRNITYSTKVPSCSPWFCFRCRNGIPRVIGPGMFRVAPFQVFLNLLVSYVPKTSEVLRYLDRPARGRQ